MESKYNLPTPLKNFTFLLSITKISVSIIRENHLTEGKKPENFTNQAYTNKGQFGELYSCTYEGEPFKQYAIKKISVKRPEDEEEVKKEITNIQKISEQVFKPSSIPPYYGYFRDEKEKVTYSQRNKVTYCLVFDFYHHQTLRKLLDDEKTPIFSFAQLKSFFSDLLLGLSFLQTLEIGHRDLKPTNLLLEKQLDGLMRIKILDYGLSKIFAIEDDEVSRFEVSVEGNKKYMSPELYNVYENDHKSKTVLNPFKSDVFSFGLICLEIGSRRTINRKDGFVELLKEGIQNNMKIMRKNYSNLVDKEKKEFEEVMGMIERSLDFDTKTRPDFLKLVQERINLKRKQEKTMINIFLEDITNEETKNFIDFAMAWKTHKDNLEEQKTQEKLWLEEKKQIQEKEKLQVMFLLILD